MLAIGAGIESGGIRIGRTELRRIPVVSSNSVVSFSLVNTATNPPTTIGSFANITSCRSQAVTLGLTNWEIFYQVPKANRPGPGGIQTGGSPNLRSGRRIERHGGAKSSPTYGTDEPGSAGGQTKETGKFGV